MSPSVFARRPLDLEACGELSRVGGDVSPALGSDSFSAPS